MHRQKRKNRIHQKDTNRMNFVNYEQGINLALQEVIKKYKDKALIIGQGVDGEKAIFGSTKDLSNLLDTPISEEAITGFCIGLALNGYKPILSHIRLDFILPSMNQIINMGTKIRGMFGNQQTLPFVIRGIIGRSWGQAGQHSGGFYPIFCHFPHLNVYAPVMPGDAYAAILQGVENPDPTIIIEHRKLYNSSIIKGKITSKNPLPTKRLFGIENWPHITLVGISRAAIECFKSACMLEREGIFADVFYPFRLNPLDITPILESANTTKKVLIVENSWINCGISAEISAQLPREVAVERMGFFPGVCPASKSLENHYFPDEHNIIAKIYDMLQINAIPYEDYTTEMFGKAKEPF